jgi:hypothetical protein
LEEIIGGVIAIISFRPGGRMQQSARAEVCYPFGREHGRHRAMKRREFITLRRNAQVTARLRLWACRTDESAQKERLRNAY